MFFLLHCKWLNLICSYSLANQYCIICEVYKQYVNYVCENFVNMEVMKQGLLVFSMKENHLTSRPYAYLQWKISISSSFFFFLLYTWWEGDVYVCIFIMNKLLVLFNVFIWVSYIGIGSALQTRNAKTAWCLSYYNKILLLVRVLPWEFPLWDVQILVEETFLPLSNDHII